VLLSVHLASRGERMTAFVLDAIFMISAVIIFYIVTLALLFSWEHYQSLYAGVTLFLFLAFVIRVMYFAHFELAWQGRTPGKKICGIRVIDRGGGALTPNAILARNLMREVEFFLPLSSLIVLRFNSSWSTLFTFGWAMAITAIPFFNRDYLRAGDMIAGTMVIKMPSRQLMGDLTSGGKSAGEIYAFTAEQLSVYGAFELQVLEELLRRPQSPDSDRLLADVAAKICRRTGIAYAIPPHGVRRFLNDFYYAERAALEHGQLFGHFKDDKNSG
jgi:uncharacterized RDD family membrane protein YckC